MGRRSAHVFPREEDNTHKASRKTNHLFTAWRLGDSAVCIHICCRLGGLSEKKNSDLPNEKGKSLNTTMPLHCRMKTDPPSKRNTSSHTPTREEMEKLRHTKLGRQKALQVQAICRDSDMQRGASGGSVALISIHRNVL